MQTLFKAYDENKTHNRSKQDKKYQELMVTLCRKPEDNIGSDPQGWCGERGKEDLPGVSNRTSLQILTVTDDEIKEDTLKSKAFIERYYKIFDEEYTEYSIWTLLETFESVVRYHPEMITIESLEKTNRNFDKHAQQILRQLSFDAAERHGREARERKHIVLIGLGLSLLTTLSGSASSFLGSNPSEQNSLQISYMGYAQILIGIVIGAAIKLISTKVEEHGTAARNLDVTLTWIEEEIKRMKVRLKASEKPYLDAIRLNQVALLEKPLMPIEAKLHAMQYIWINHKMGSPEKSLFETVAQLQNCLFGFQETAHTVETSLIDFKSKDGSSYGLFKQPSVPVERTDLAALAIIYQCIILLISETLLPNNLHYQIINEAVVEKVQLNSEEKVREDGDIEIGTLTTNVKSENPLRYMVIYTTGRNHYYPILSPLNVTWDVVKSGLASLSSPIIDIPEDGVNIATSLLGPDFNSSLCL